MIGRRQAEPWWLSWAGERRIKDRYQFSVFSFQPSGAAGKIPKKLARGGSPGQSLKNMKIVLKKCLTLVPSYAFMSAKWGD